jgi:hypothetical protein
MFQTSKRTTINKEAKSGQAAIEKLPTCVELGLPVENLGKGFCQFLILTELKAASFTTSVSEQPAERPFSLFFFGRQQVSCRNLKCCRWAAIFRQNPFSGTDRLPGGI